MHAGKRYADTSVHAEWGTAEIGDKLTDLSLRDRLRRLGRGLRRRGLIVGLNHEGTRAVAPKSANKAVGVASTDVKVVRQRAANVSLGKQPVEKGTDHAVRVAARPERKRQREKRNAERISFQGLVRVEESELLPLLFDNRNPDAVEPDGEGVRRHHQSAFWTVILRPSCLRTWTRRWSCSVSFPCSREER